MTCLKDYYHMALNGSTTSLKDFIPLWCLGAGMSYDDIDLEIRCMPEGKDAVKVFMDMIYDNCLTYKEKHLGNEVTQLALSFDNRETLSCITIGTGVTDGGNACVIIKLSGPIIVAHTFLELLKKDMAAHLENNVSLSYTSSVISGSNDAE